MNQRAGFRIVRNYPAAFLYTEADQVCVPLTYRKVWNDGFGARGWKLDLAIGDPAVIASTRETGDVIPTSVLVHDVLDHLLSGFTASGHRAEAMAAIQLSRRTGSPAQRDFEQMVKEDVRFGNVNGEAVSDFLPQTLLALLPEPHKLKPREMLDRLERQLGRETLVEALVQRFFELGARGEGHARASWRALGLDSSNVTQIGLSLQRVLAEVDQHVEAAGVDQLRGLFRVGNLECALELRGEVPRGLRGCYRQTVARLSPEDGGGRAS